MNKSNFRNYCKDCSEWFKPTGKYCVYCDKCLVKRRRQHNKRMILKYKLIKTTKNHKCPYLKDNKYCTHKYTNLICRGSKLAKCRHTDNKKCELYRIQTKNKEV